MAQSVTKIDLQGKSKLYFESKNVYAQYVYVTPEFDTPIKVKLSVAGGSKGGSRSYCDVWVSWHHDRTVNLGGGRVYGVGSAFAGGFGYDRSSAAVQYAFESAGVKFEQDFAGLGSGVIIDAINALAAALGHTGGKVLAL